MPLIRSVVLFALSAVACSAAPEFQVKFAPEARSGPVDGRLIVVVSTQLEGEPRFQVGTTANTAQVFGVDVDNWSPGAVTHVAERAVGAPIRNIRDLPPGTYSVQAVLNLYETFHRSDGHIVKLHMDAGEGQAWNRAPGNLYSKPQRVEIGPASAPILITMTEVIPPIVRTSDTKYLRHVQIESKLLTKFWGRPMHLGALVLVPEGFEEHPEQRYPILFLQTHFSGDRFAGAFFSPTPPQADVKPNERQRAEQSYHFYQDWTSGRLPQMLIVISEHATPYYDDSYGVNSANMGPYGDALTRELYPYIEQHFRAIGEPWARVVFGGSTGGWMSLAQQIFYPEYFGGAWGFCPDPVDFHAFQMVDVYNDKNAYWDEGAFARVPKLIGRLPNEHIMITMEQMSLQENALGTRGRSGGQMDAFHATFGPVDRDGYPAKLWDADTGAIDPETAKYWREHFDLTAFMQREWERIGPRLVGKLHVTMGTKDTYYLNVASERMQSFLETTKLPGKGPYYGGSFVFGNNKPHCYAGEIPEGVPMLSFYTRVFAEHMRTMAPKGSDVESWRR